MRRIYIAALIVLACARVGFADTFGNLTKEQQSIASQKFLGSSFTAPANGTINSITAYVYQATNSTAKINYGIYNANGTTPGTHIAHGTAVAPSMYNDWYTINVTGNIVNGSNYFLVAQQETANNYTFYRAITGVPIVYTSTYTFDSWGDNPGGLTSNNYTMSIYATYTPEGTKARRRIINN